MSGHSKWSTIKHKKAKEDSKRGKAFTKLIKEITVAARVGGGDPNGNPRLRTLVEKAKAINMPIENTTRAIKKGTGELPGIHYEDHVYEGYGPGGIAVIIETLSDNKNRTVAELRHIFSLNSGNLAESGSVSWMFAKKGVIRALGAEISSDDLLEKLFDFDIHDITQDENTTTIICNTKELESIKKEVTSCGLHIEHAEIEWVPSTTMTIPENQTDKAVELLSELQDHDDVQNVYTNMA